MNRFRTKRKAKDDSSAEPDTVMPSFKGFLRGRKAQEEEPKKDIDLSTALPSQNEFRTSLLMTGLSARFSMLREQDDPNTKIGKASDDSVLFPKRQSRLMDYSYAGGLTDIAEVESIKAPFARMDSYASADDADSMKGSIMSRAKPTEGNNLFGGRQKILVGGRTLYESDVAVSSFQKWKREERERRLREEQGEKEDKAEERAAAESGFRPSEEDSFATRSESPLLVGYNRRRETSSTTSSSMARNSTAATSVASQPAASIKDWQFQATAPASASSTPNLDRSVTRTRRLYEQGLNQDLHDHQSSALFRIDTLTGKRPFGSRTPDLSNNVPSPTGPGYGFPERRGILSKASAPNLRSISPPATASSAGTMDLGGARVCNLAETKLNFVGTPPLSPPISEAGEFPSLAIHQNDRGKATAMGVFQKPAQAYDESKYAQRQLQLQQGRETPTLRHRTESNVTGRSRSSSSSAQRQHLAPKTELSIQTSAQTTGKDQVYSPMTFLDDSDASPIAPEMLRNHNQRPVPTATGASQIPPALERPSDRDHPAFRQAALPTPLSITGTGSSEPSPVSDFPDAESPNLADQPVDSPTLGPASGLSGLVRQHMRSESNTSSVYGGPQTSGLESRFPADTRDSSLIGVLGAKSSNWQDQHWNPYDDEENEERANRDTLVPEGKPTRGQLEAETASDRSSSVGIDNEEDEFASQLASARKRVQQRMTSYVESDSSRSTSPLPPAEAHTRDIPAPPRSNPLGILRGKSSRGSLAERGRDGSSQNKAMKLLGLGASTMSTSPNPTQQSFEDSGLAPMKEEEPLSSNDDAVRDIGDAQERKAEADRERDADSRSTKSQDREEENVHPGLRAFRQARRELQRRKELDTLARHQPHLQPGQEETSRRPSLETSPSREAEAGGNSMSHRTPSRDRKPPPVYYQQRAPSEESHRGGTASRGPFRPPSQTERERSGSDTSNSNNSVGNRAQSRPPRLRNNSSPYDDRHHQAHGQVGMNGNMMGHGGSRQPMMLRSPGLPGTDIRRSPIMPPQGYPGGAPSPNRFDRSTSAGNLAVQPNRAHLDSLSVGQGQTSPITPRSAGLPPSPFLGSSNGSNGGAITPTTLGPRRPSAPPAPGPAVGYTTTSTLNESMKKHVNKKDISDPTFVMSTHRLPTVNLPHSSSSPDVSQDSGSRSRSGSRARAGSNAGSFTPPPLPPINPRRKQEGGTRGRSVLNGFMGRKGDAEDEATGSLSSPHLPLSTSTGALPSPNLSDDPRSAFSVSDDEEKPVNSRWRLRKQASEAHGLNSRAAALNGGGSGASPASGYFPGSASVRDTRAFTAAGPPASRSVHTPSAKPSSSASPLRVPGGMI